MNAILQNAIISSRYPTKWHNNQGVLDLYRTTLFARELVITIIFSFKATILGFFLLFWAIYPKLNPAVKCDRPIF